ncbi:MAG: ArsR/SmtB family transcription factor [Spirochaetota bacterium]
MLTKTHRTLSTDAEISAYLHRTRMDILAALRDGPATGSQIAERLGVHPANLTRHIRILRNAGLVRLERTRDTGRNLEKYYAATAFSFDVAPEADRLTAPHKKALAFARSDLSAAMSALSDDDERPVLCLVSDVTLDPNRLNDFRRAFEDLVASFKEDGSASAAPYRTNLSVYPAPADDRGTRVEITRKEEMP